MGDDGTSVLERPLTETGKPKSLQKNRNDSRYRQNHGRQDLKQKQDNCNDEWKLLLHDDHINTREWAALVLVQVAGRSEVEAYRAMQEAHKQGVATVATSLPFEIAEAYHEGL